jgi:crotonobetainyl-CoA:carnitine CoA-transferase CaiB-like acyl-CoA transferase
MIGFEGRVWDEPSGLDAVGWDASNRLYQASDGWFYLACPGGAFHDKIASLEGLERAHAVAPADLADWLSQRFLTRTANSWVDALTAAGIAAHRYVTMVEVVRDPVSMALKASAVLDHPGIGKALGVALPTFGGEQDVGELLVARRPGMDTLPILESLGFDAKEILDMLKTQAIAAGENPVVETTMRPGYWNHPDGVLSLACKDSLRATLDSISGLLSV